MESAFANMELGAGRRPPVAVGVERSLDVLALPQASVELLGCQVLPVPGEG